MELLNPLNIIKVIYIKPVILIKGLAIIIKATLIKAKKSLINPGFILNLASTLINKILLKDIMLVTSERINLITFLKEVN